MIFFIFIFGLLFHLQSDSSSLNDLPAIVSYSLKRYVPDTAPLYVYVYMYVYIHVQQTWTLLMTEVRPFFLSAARVLSQS